LFGFYFFKRLTKGAKNEDLKKVLDKILAVQKINSEGIAALTRQ